jgi:hypothetical protein
MWFVGSIIGSETNVVKFNCKNNSYCLDVSRIDVADIMGYMRLAYEMWKILFIYCSSLKYTL